jgi:hypothetical protein
MLRHARLSPGRCQISPNRSDWVISASLAASAVMFCMLREEEVVMPDFPVVFDSTQLKQSE